MCRQPNRRNFQLSTLSHHLWKDAMNRRLYATVNFQLSTFMKRRQTWWIGLALLAFVVITTFSQVRGQLGAENGGAIAQAQSPAATPASPKPSIASPQGSPASSAPSPAAPNSPSPTPQGATPSPASPGLQPLPGQPNAPPLPAVPTSVLPAAPALTAPPLPLSGEYKDPAGRYKIGILKGFTVSPLAGSVLLEAPDGNLAYSVVALSPQKLALEGNFISGEVLAELAQTTFQQGEDFQVGTPMAIANGIYLEWTGSLTIAGQTQPVGGVILARQSQTAVLQVLIASTQAGAGQMPGAIRTLAESLQTP